MGTRIGRGLILMIFCFTVVLVASSLWAAEEQGATELAKKLQNPVSDLISVPFQNNTNFHYGPLNGTQNILNIQPVIPVT